MDAVRQCQVAMLAVERVRVDQLHPRLFSTGSLSIVYYVALINFFQQYSQLDGGGVDVAAPDEGVRARGFVESFNIAGAAGCCQFPPLR